jgi:hypothetical protein
VAVERHQEQRAQGGDDGQLVEAVPRVLRERDAAAGHGGRVAEQVGQP